MSRYLQRKFLEEPELAERFGDAYLSYKRATHFTFPQLPAAPPSAPRPRSGWSARS